MSDRITSRSQSADDAAAPAAPHEPERTTTARLAEQSALLELAPDPIFARDAQRRITFWNTAAERLYGISRAEAMGRHPADVLHTVYPIALEEIERRVTEEGYWEGDLIQTTRSGRQVTVASRWGALYDQDGGLAGLLEINRDVTERLAADAQRERERAEFERERMSNRLVRAQRLESLGHLAGGIAHDFNNLLAIISGYSAMSIKRLRRRADSEDVIADLEQIEQAAVRAATLTRQLLAFARQDAVEPEVIDANSTLAEMRELLARTLGPHVQLVTELDPELWLVRIDPGQLGQILVNLAVNSRTAMPEGGTLLIETSRSHFAAARPLSHGVLPPGDYVRIRVNDTGGGMDREVAEHAFDPFFTTGAMGSGTGLGLATVHGIVSQAQGHVELYSEPGRGTTVTVLLPAAEGEVAADPDSDPGRSPRSRGGETILVVDDEPGLRALIVANLADAGYTVLGAGGSLEALRIAEGADLDLVVTDVVMPDMLGQQLAERLRAADPDLDIIFMSGFALTSDEREAELTGPLLQKPFSEYELLATVAEVLRRP